MSKLKCPFCNGELVGTIGHPICRNQNCVMCDDQMPQDLLEELIRTRKALGIAVDALKSADEYYMYCAKDKTLQGNAGIIALGMDNIIAKALEQITALEQKDVK